MGNVVVFVAVSLDGMFEGPSGDIGWHIVDEEFLTHVNDVLGHMGAFLHGRVMYENMAAVWPTAEQDPSMTPVMHEFAPIWRSMPKFVYSRTLDHAGWNSTIVRDVVPEEVEALKAQVNGDMALSGADIAASFAAHDLVDEYRLYVNPVVLGAGRKLFPESGQRRPLQLVETHRFGNGVVMLRYRVISARRQ